MKELVYAIMDQFSLKKDNRKKFQDKQRLKNRHATPSDRKHRALNKQAEKDPGTEGEEKEEEEPKPLPSNANRYQDDITLEFEELADEQTSKQVNSMLKRVLKERKQDSDFIKEDGLDTNNITTKDLSTMGVESLNKLLGRDTTTITSYKPPTMPVSAPSTQNKPNENQQSSKVNLLPSNPNSNLPSSLSSDQDFLDSII